MKISVFEGIMKKVGVKGVLKIFEHYNKILSDQSSKFQKMYKISFT